ncbi:MAG TPA: non-homologous end-joining DNA ligase [Acidimicrobiales bacterium]|nr:non-homologous end-joining DNA ligase [Acidimicrobiales bacterium]
MQRLPGTGLLEALPVDRQRLLRAVHLPDWVPPMLATLTDRRFSDSRWLYERKLDGERCLAFYDGHRVGLLSRNRKVLDGTYPELVDALADRSAGATGWIVDGEVVAMDRGQTSFSRLQQRMGITDPAVARRSPVAVYYYLFDLLWLDGFDVTALPLRDRKALLRKVFTFGDPLRYTAHRNTEGEAFFAEACARRWEGVIAKRADAPYRAGRSPDWLKFKCAAGQEMVVGGFTDPAGTRTGFGALLVGYYQDGELRYAGKVGTGYDRPTLTALRDRLDRLVVPRSPFARAGGPTERAHWVRPELVAEIGFSEWTTDGKLRQPRYLGLRDDKAATEVVRESPGA